jgi:D-psicose/D-tagatose/L-ribulose 3-epimerase
MKTGMNLLLWTPVVTEDHLGLIESIKNWGFDGVEFPMFDPDASPWSKFAQALDGLGLGRTACTIMPEGANLIGETAEERETGVSHLKRCIDSIATLGGEILLGPLHSPCGRLVGRGSNDDEWKWCVEGLRAAGEHAKPAGIVLALEGLNRFETYMINCQADLSRMTDEIGLDNVGQMYDTFHANIEEKDIAEAIRTGGSRIRTVHISANDRATPGEDHIDWSTTFATLKEIGYDGWLTIESFGKALPEVAAATCIWRSMAPSEEHVSREGLKMIQSLWNG